MRAGLVFLIAMVGMATLAIADLSFVQVSNPTGYRHANAYANDERAVVARSVVMQPGDRLVLSPALVDGGTRFASYDFYIVNGGDRFRLLEGDSPRATYMKLDDVGTWLRGGVPIGVGSCCEVRFVNWERVDDSFAHRQGQPVPPTSAARTREAEFALTDQPDTIDLVWVYHYASSTAGPTSASAQKTVVDELQQKLAARGSFGGTFDLPTVYDATVAVTHPTAVAAIGLLAVVAAASLGAHTWSAYRRSFETLGASSESLLRLYDAAGDHLASVRDLLLGGPVIVLAITLHVGGLVPAGAEYYRLARAGIGGPFDLMGFALDLLYVVTIVAWGFAAFRVHRALRRWRARRDSPPIDLVNG